MSTSEQKTNKNAPEYDIHVAPGPSPFPFPFSFSFLFQTSDLPIILVF